MNTLLSLSKHFKPEIKSTYTAVVCLANIKDNNGIGMCDDIIDVILQYAGDIDISIFELEILKGTIAKIKYTVNYTRYVNNDIKHLSYRTWSYVCPCCPKKFESNSYYVLINHCVSDGHIANRYKKSLKLHSRCIDRIKHSIISGFNNGYGYNKYNKEFKITSLTIQRLIFKDTWKTYLREKKHDKDEDRKKRKDKKRKKKEKAEKEKNFNIINIIN